MQEERAAGPTASQSLPAATTRSGAAAGCGGGAPSDCQGLTCSASATCPVGEVLLGGGARLTSTATSANGLARVDVVASYASAATTWTATMLIRTNSVAASNATITVCAICTS